ncbi:hypothetical protein MAIT1_04025 [Magnetofaba australis IT-1]|uniref:Uncharacterized protein n=1 Tax=Magnetofaba australis IT-1 TaxID=1434232 RepID=A0A1Y2K595_9PROT|nr:hypothetical protein MAIT1_04025 [Magnetofaba australis IT-1]
MRQLLSPYRDYLDGLGAGILRREDDGLDYGELSRAIMNLDEKAPMELLEALYLIHEMSTESGMDRLLAAIRDQQLAIDVPVTATPMDVAVLVYLENRELLERQHAMVFIQRARSYYCFDGSESWRGEFTLPDEEKLRALEQQMDDWFDAHHRGRGCRVMLFDHGPRMILVVRHGKSYRRDSAVKKDGESASVFYRPECFDLVVYDREFNELSIRTDNVRERAMYATTVGLHLFGDAQFFRLREKYTLKPLLDRNQASLSCGDLDELDWVRLTAVAFQSPDEGEDVEIQKGKDLIESFARKGFSFPHDANLVNASFNAKFRGAPRPRSFTISNANKACFTRDGDSVVIEKWMRRRGFMNGPIRNRNHARPEPPLASH